MHDHDGKKLADEQHEKDDPSNLIPPSLMSILHPIEHNKRDLSHSRIALTQRLCHCSEKKRSGSPPFNIPVLLVSAMFRDVRRISQSQMSSPPTCSHRSKCTQFSNLLKSLSVARGRKISKVELSASCSSLAGKGPKSLSDRRPERQYTKPGAPTPPMISQSRVLENTMLMSLAYLKFDLPAKL